MSEDSEGPAVDQSGDDSPGGDVVRDPIAEAAGDSRDLYDVSTWSPRSQLDLAAVRMYEFWAANRQLIVSIVVGLVLFLQIAIGILLWILVPPLAFYTFLSVVPALLLVLYVWYSDRTIREPIRPMLATFVLGMFAAGLSIIVNESFGILLGPLVAVLVAPPTEELAKLLGVRIFAYESEQFNTVFDGAIYGALAGLGFATIENAIYIANNAGIVGLTTITTVRAIAAPGHVIWSALAGYYLGLAKFNPEFRGPIVVKGLVVAVLFHAGHNGIGLIVPGGAGNTLIAVLLLLAVAGFVLLRKLYRYRTVYHEVYGTEPRLLLPRRTAASRPSMEPHADPYDQLKNLQELHQLGVITDEEFAEKRRKILDEI